MAKVVLLQNSDSSCWRVGIVRSMLYSIWQFAALTLTIGESTRFAHGMDKDRMVPPLSLFITGPVGKHISAATLPAACESTPVSSFCYVC